MDEYRLVDPAIGAETPIARSMSAFCPVPTTNSEGPILRAMRPIIAAGGYAPAVANDRSAEPTPDIAYYDTGALRYRGFQLDGEMHGKWEFLRKDGSVMRAGRFEHGRQVGVWRTFDRAGAVVKETNFSKHGS